jgi:hypothetical protein
MVFLQYKGRIHRGKFTARSIRYILSDQAARLFPALQRRWLLPVEPLPIADAAQEMLPLPSATVASELPEPFRKLGISYPKPVQQTHRVYSVDGVVVTGWAGAMIKDGLLLTVRPQHNWVSSLRAHPHKMRQLPGSRPYFNLMTPIPARSHMFHWLFDSILPLVSFLESGQAGTDLGLIVNAKLSEIQARTIGFIKERYGITVLETLAKNEAVFVPHIKSAVADHTLPRGLQSPLGLALLDDIGRFIAGDAAQEETPRRIYVSRNDARLRRVLNEDAILPELEARGFERVTLKGMPIARQVALFLNAEAVVGPHGAAFAHASWCKRGTKIVEFIPGLNPRRKTTRPLANADFWFIALQRNLDYGCYFGGQVQHEDAFNIPRDLLIHALDT